MNPQFSKHVSTVGDGGKAPRKRDTNGCPLSGTGCSHTIIGFFTDVSAAVEVYGKGKPEDRNFWPVSEQKWKDQPIIQSFGFTGVAKITGSDPGQPPPTIGAEQGIQGTFCQWTPSSGIKKVGQFVR